MPAEQLHRGRRLSFILGMRIPRIQCAFARWRREHPGEQIPDGHVFTQPWPAGPNGGRRDRATTDHC